MRAIKNTITAVITTITITSLGPSKTACIDYPLRKIEKGRTRIHKMSGALYHGSIKLSSRPRKLLQQVMWRHDLFYSLARQVKDARPDS
ncbi:hypothetical protein STSP2_02105 [Anaerohalosphaera lusitana]|uniref:Transposase n=1 Tax=Anaerohalosphaera lusitana TaxID=1936003 RepID=A0A1U9NMH2_9BACT|nr:hypothetical protein STSP2_02105 [Anaerohalosphaera lusitana]